MKTSRTGRKGRRYGGTTKKGNPTKNNKSLNRQSSQNKINKRNRSTDPDIYTLKTSKTPQKTKVVVERKEVGTKNRVLTEAMHLRLMISLGMIILGLIGLMMKVYAIQSDSKDYNQKVLSQQRYDSRDIPYRRGDIMDRNGTYLATSNKVYNLILDPYQINQAQEKYLDPTVSLLAEVFEYDEQNIREIIASNSDARYIRQEKEVSYEVKERFEKRKDEINKDFAAHGLKSRVHGVWFEDAYLRVYPYNSLACNAVGFANSDNTLGTGGIEQYYNDELIGTSGREYGYLNDDYNLERVIKPASDGNSIVSTLDSNIQKIVEKHISDWEAEMGSKVTACIVMDPNSGEILAMATSKTYDLNNPRNIEKYYTQDDFNALDENGQNEIMNDIWRNYCVSDTYEPGSPSKIFTVAAALEEGSVKPEDSFFCDGGQYVGDRWIRCAVRSGHGSVTLKESLIRSCNDAMMQIVAGLGTEKFSTFQHLFGIGEKSGIDLPGEPDTSSLIYHIPDMTSIDLATNSFGQNYNCTMVQMSAAICSVINGGYYYEPHIVKQILNSQGSVIKDIEPKLVRETVSSSTSAFIREALRDVIERGTGKAAKVEGYDVGGKTGTSQKLPRGSGKYLLSFAGFAPVDDPQVFCYVIVDEPNTDNQAHSIYASNLFSKIMTDVLPYMGIFPKDEAAAQKIQEERDAKLKAQESSEAQNNENSAGENSTESVSSDTKTQQNNSEPNSSTSAAKEKTPNTSGEGNASESSEYETDEYIEDANADFEGDAASASLSSNESSAAQQSKEDKSTTAAETKKAVKKETAKSEKNKKKSSKNTSKSSQSETTAVKSSNKKKKSESSAAGTEGNKNKTKKKTGN
jgi:cell division protein ftsI/penicillin-binding protein 2